MRSAVGPALGDDLVLGPELDAFHGLAGRDLGRSQPALERRLIALPWLKSVHYSDLRALVQPSRSGSVMTGSGSKPEVSPTFAISPLMAVGWLNSLATS